MYKGLYYLLQITKMHYIKYMSTYIHIYCLIYTIAEVHEGYID